MEASAISLSPYLFSFNHCKSQPRSIQQLLFELALGSFECQTSIAERLFFCLQNHFNTVFSTFFYKTIVVGFISTIPIKFPRTII